MPALQQNEGSRVTAATEGASNTAADPQGHSALSNLWERATR